MGQFENDPERNGLVNADCGRPQEKPNRGSQWAQKDEGAAAAGIIFPNAQKVAALATKSTEAARPDLFLDITGSDRDIGHKIIRGDLPFTHSEKSYDWLGHGIYFWEADQQRALEWAQWKKKIGECPNPFVIGAILDLKKCFDLLERENLDILSGTYSAFVKTKTAANLELPKNLNSPKGASQNKVMRHLDCAVINHLHATMADGELEPFDSVRGLFVEGLPAYEGGEIYRLTHAQIAIRNEACIKGIFLPR